MAGSRSWNSGLTRSRRWGLGQLSALLGLVVAMMLAPAQGGTVYVSTESELASAIAGNTYIYLSNDISLSPAGNGNAAFEITTGGITDLYIDGDGYTLGFPTASAGNGHIFFIGGDGASTVMEIKNLVLKNAYDDQTGTKTFGSSTTNVYGGAIYNAGSLTISSLSFISCIAGGSTGGTGGGAIFSTGTLTAYDTSFSSCSGAFGGAIRTSGTGNLYSVTFSSNTCTNQAGCTSSSDIHGTVACYSSCTAGTYGTSQGMALISADSGTPTCESFSGCTDCSTGKAGSSNYATSSSDCTACEAGKYQAAAAQTSCTTCPGGFSCPSTGLASATGCEAGQYSSDGASSCTSCGSGQISIAVATTCTACPTGKYASNAADTTNGGGLETQVTLAATVCNDCPAGYKSSTTASIVCIICSERTSSAVGSSSCEICEKSYFEDTTIDDDSKEKTCKECSVDGFTCDSAGTTLSTLNIDKGYFRISDLSHDSRQIRSCPMGSAACAGGTNFSRGGQSYCNEGYRGPYCAVCADDYFYDAALNLCSKCDNASVSPTFVSFLLVIAAFAICAAWSSLRRASNLSEKAAKGLDMAAATDVRTVQGMVDGALTTLENGRALEEGNEEPDEQSFFAKLKPKAKIMVAFAQLVSTMSFNLAPLPWPASFSKFLSVFDFVNLNVFQVIPFDCMVPTTYYSKLLTTTAVPLGLGAILLFFLRVVYKGNAKKQQSVFSVFLLLAYLVLPTCSSAIIHVFKCDFFEDTATAYMNADYSLTCWTNGDSMFDGDMSSSRKGWVIYACLMFFIYPVGIPCFFAVLLWGERSKLCPPLEEYGVRYLFIRHSKWEVIKESRGGDSILSFLASSYQPHAFWFEVFESYRRLFLSSMLIFFADGSAAQVVVAMLLNLFSIKVQSYYCPYTDDYDDMLAEVAQWQLFCVFFAALLIRVDTTGDSAADQRSLAGILIFLTSVGFMVLGFLVVYDIRSSRPATGKQSKMDGANDASWTSMTTMTVDRSADGDSKTDDGGASERQPSPVKNKLKKAQSKRWSDFLPPGHEDRKPSSTPHGGESEL